MIRNEGVVLLVSLSYMLGILFGYLVGTNVQHSLMVFGILPAIFAFIAFLASSVIVFIQGTKV